MSDELAEQPVTITQYKWAGRFWFFKISSKCNECDLTTSILRAMMEKEFKGKPVKLEIKPWLDNVFFCLKQGAWHAPIIMINSKLFYQFRHKKPLFDRAELARLVNEALLTSKGKGN